MRMKETIQLVGFAIRVDTQPSLADLKLRLKQVIPIEELVYILNLFYQMDTDLFVAAQDPRVRFTALVLGDPESGFALDRATFNANYVPVEPTTAPCQWEGRLGQLHRRHLQSASHDRQYTERVKSLCLEESVGQKRKRCFESALTAR